MSFALLCHTAKASVNQLNVTTDAMDTSGCDLLVVSVHTYAISGTFTDSKSNTWTALTKRGGSGPVWIQLYYCRNPTVGSGHTFTLAFTQSIYPSICVSGWSGSKVSPFDVEAGSFNPYPGSITPAEDNELLIAGICYNPVGTVSVDLGFTIADQVYVVGGGMGACQAYQVQTTATARNPTFSHSTGFTKQATAIAAFKAAAAASGQPAMRRYGRLRPLEIGREGVLIY